VDPRWPLMASTIQPSVEANVSTLMNVVDEEVWRAKGLFDKVDSVVLCTDTFISHFAQPQLPSLTRSFLSSGLAPSFAEYLSFSLGVPQSTERLTVAQC
jgi:hypothetical protein